MRELDASNLDDLFSIDAPLINRAHSWIVDELGRSLSDLEELRFAVLLEEIPDRPGTYRKTGQLLITALFTDNSRSPFLLIEESSFSHHL